MKICKLRTKKFYNIGPKVSMNKGTSFLALVPAQPAKRGLTGASVSPSL